MSFGMFALIAILWRSSVLSGSDRGFLSASASSRDSLLTGSEPRLSWPLKSETEIWEVAASNLARSELPKKVEIVAGLALDTLPKADRPLQGTVGFGLS